MTTLTIELDDRSARLEVPDTWSVSEPSSSGLAVTSRRVVTTDLVVLVIDRISREATYGCGAATVSGHVRHRYTRDHQVEPQVANVRVPGATTALLSSASYDDEAVGRIRMFHLSASADGGDVIAVQALVPEECDELVGAVIEVVASLTMEVSR